MMFAAVNQLNMGGPSVVSDAAEFFMFANHNLVAGQLAMEMSEFSSAHTLFINGINFLRCSDNHWQNHYKFSLDEIFSLQQKLASNPRKSKQRSRRQTHLAMTLLNNENVTSLQQA
jgi:predicted ATPase